MTTLPYQPIPLRVHTNGQWFTTRRICKIKTFFYFGSVRSDPTGERAMRAYLAVADRLETLAPISVQKRLKIASSARVHAFARGLENGLIWHGL